MEPGQAYGLWSVDVHELTRLARGRTPTAARLAVAVDDAPDGTCFIASPVRQAFNVSAATWTCAAEQAPGDGLLGCDPSRRWQWLDRPDGDAALLPRFAATPRPVGPSDGSVGFDVLDDVLAMLAGNPDRPFGWGIASSAPARLLASESSVPPALDLHYGGKPPPWSVSLPCAWSGFHRIATAHGQSNVVTRGPAGVVYGATGVTVYAINEATDSVLDQYSTFDKIHALEWQGSEGVGGVLYIGDTRDGLVLVDTDAKGHFIGELSHYIPPTRPPDEGPAPATEGLRVGEPCASEGGGSHLAYLADGDGVDILDVSRPLLPHRVGSLADPRLWYSSAIAIEEDCGHSRSVYLGRAGVRPGGCPGTTAQGSCLGADGRCACVWSKVDASNLAHPIIEFSAGTGWAAVALDIEAADGRVLIAGSGGGLLTCGTERDDHACVPSPRHRAYAQRSWPTWLNLDREGRLVGGYYPQPAGAIAYLGLLSDWLPAPAATGCGDSSNPCGPVTKLWGDNVNDAVLVGDTPADAGDARLLVSHDDYGIVKYDPAGTPPIQTVIPGGVTNAATLDGTQLLVADLMYGASEYTVSNSDFTGRLAPASLVNTWTRPGFERARAGSDARDLAATDDLLILGNSDGVFTHPRKEGGELVALPQPGGAHHGATAVAARKGGDATYIFAGLEGTPPTIAAWRWTQAEGATLVGSTGVGVPRGAVWDLELTKDWVVAAGWSVPMMLLPAQPRAGEPWDAVLSCGGWAHVPQLAVGSLPGLGEVVFLAADGGVHAARVDDLQTRGVGSICTQDDVLTGAVAAVLTGAPQTQPTGVSSIAFDSDRNELLVGYRAVGDHPSDVVAIGLSDPAHPRLGAVIDLKETITSLDAGGGLIAVTSPDLGTGVYRSW